MNACWEILTKYNFVLYIHLRQWHQVSGASAGVPVDFAANSFAKSSVGGKYSGMSFLDVIYHINIAILIVTIGAYS
jgi:hypothetical protein